MLPGGKYSALLVGCVSNYNKVPDKSLTERKFLTFLIQDREFG